MRRFTMILAVLCLGPGGALADEVIAPDPAIEGTIQRQFDAFAVDDFARAFTFASPGIQGMFGTPENFGRMVQNGYPMVWRPGAVQFLDLREEGGRLWQKVMIRDQSGALHVLDYQMIEGPEGWRIDGVRILDAPQFGA